MRPLPSSLKSLFPANPGSMQKAAARPMALQSNLDIQTLDNFVSCNEGKIIQLKTYEILWIKKGTGMLTVDLQDIAIEESKIYLLRPGHLRFVDSEQKLHGYYISISSDFFHLIGEDANISLLNRRFDGPVIIDADEEVEEAEEILNKIGKEVGTYGVSRMPIVKGLFKIFMLYLVQKIQVHSNAGMYCAEQELTNKFMQLLGNNFTTKKLVADYAAELCVTPGHLNRIVKKVSGFPVSHHIQQQIIFEAKKQAKYSGRSMKEIAYSLGFDDTAHFSKYFKNNSGMNFSNFKKIAYL